MEYCQAWFIAVTVAPSFLGTFLIFILSLIFRGCPCAGFWTLGDRVHISLLLWANGKGKRGLRALQNEDRLGGRPGHSDRPRNPPCTCWMMILRFGLGWFQFRMMTNYCKMPRDFSYFHPVWYNSQLMISCKDWWSWILFVPNGRRVEKVYKRIQVFGEAEHLWSVFRTISISPCLTWTGHVDQFGAYHGCYWGDGHGRRRRRSSAI